MSTPPAPQPVEIESLLHRRTDLSTFLVHLTKNSERAGSARENLLAILSNREIQAVSSFGLAARATQGTPYEESQKVVCFTETPLEHTWMLCQPITGRSVNLSSYGIAFTKDWARERGVNPIWYIDITPGHDWLTKPIENLINQALAASTEPLSQTGNAIPDILRLTPFMEPMGEGIRSKDGTPYRKDFSWEREWRHQGDLHFPTDAIVAILAPEADHGPFVRDLNRRRRPGTTPPLLDPNWSLERMIVALAQADR